MGTSGPVHDHRYHGDGQDHHGFDGVDGQGHGAALYQASAQVPSSPSPSSTNPDPPRHKLATAD